MSKIKFILRLPLYLLVGGIILASYVAMYLKMVSWPVPIIYTVIIILYLIGREKIKGGQQWEGEISQV